MEQEKYVGTTQPTEEIPELKQTAASSTNKAISSVKDFTGEQWRLNWLEIEEMKSEYPCHWDPVKGRIYAALCFKM